MKTSHTETSHWVVRGRGASIGVGRCRLSSRPILRNLEALKGPPLSRTMLECHGEGKWGHVSILSSGSKAFRRCVLRPSILFPSGTRPRRTMRQDGEGLAERGPPPRGTGLVGEQAGEGLPQVADGFGLGLILTRGPALGRVGRAEAVCQGLGFAETERQGTWRVTRPGTRGNESRGACPEARWVSPVITRRRRPGTRPSNAYAILGELHALFNWQGGYWLPPFSDTETGLT